jgi:ribose transport system permease protein
MAERHNRHFSARLLADYGMLLVLFLLCLYYGWATYAEQEPTGAAAGEQLARDILRQSSKSAKVLIVARDTQDDAAYADTLARRLTEAGLMAATVKGQPADARAALERIAHSGGKLDLVAANQATRTWTVLQNLDQKFPALGEVRVILPKRYRWPNFLKADNLLNIANQIVVIAVVAIGMTMVIITGGIDLSVGSLIALSAVAATLLIRDAGGAEAASPFAMVLGCLGGIAVCGLVGLFSGVMITAFNIPPFIETLAMMLVASGLAFIVTDGQSVYQVPDTFVWLGRGTDVLGIPNAVLLMILLYVLAHVVMTRTVVGRYIYAVGGNAEAARLSGVPVQRIVLLVYTVSGALAGLGGIILASQLKSGAPTYGVMYELYVIAAVVVGGTSLSGGEGKILGTLIGAFIIAVIQNGMNLTGVKSFPQRVVLGLVILGAVLLDRFKQHAWRLRLTRKRRALEERSPVIQ